MQNGVKGLAALAAAVIASTSTARAEEVPPTGGLAPAAPAPLDPAPPPAPAPPPGAMSPDAEPPLAQRLSLRLAVPAGVLAGNTTYHISASDGAGNAVDSELEFPLGAALAGVRAELATRRDPERNRWTFHLSALGTVASGDGPMKDSDWISDALDVQTVGTAHPGKDIYSESRTRLQGLLLDAGVEYTFRPRPGATVGAIAGVTYDRYDYSASDVSQVGYGPYASSATGSVSGTVLEYRVSYLVPYLGARGTLAAGGRLQLGAEAWFSPFAHAEDRDDHVLRYKLSTGDADGIAVSASVDARLALTPTDSVQLSATHLRIETTGWQRQTFYAGQYQGEAALVHDRITAERTSFLLVVAHRL